LPRNGNTYRNSKGAAIVKTAAQAAANWQGSSGRATTDYVSGVQNTTKDQAALAVAAGSRYIQGVQDAYSSGRWAAGIQRGGTAYWKQQTEKKSVNYGAGYAAGVGNYTAAAAKVMAAIAQGVANLPPRGDINQNLQRSASLATYLHGLKGQLGAR
jgi:hypothetical protein